MEDGPDGPGQVTTSLDNKCTSLSLSKVMHYLRTIIGHSVVNLSGVWTADPDNRQGSTK